MPANVVLPPELIDAVVAGACEGHRIVAKSHIEEEGWDSTTSGFNSGTECPGTGSPDSSTRSTGWRSSTAPRACGLGGPITRSASTTAASALTGTRARSISMRLLCPSRVRQHGCTARARCRDHAYEPARGLHREHERGCIDIYLGAPITNPISQALRGVDREDLVQARKRRPPLR